MELHRFTTDVDDIVNEAVQELKIENEIRKVEATWRQTDLVVAKYQKDGVDRSWVLRAADEIKTELEDNLLNLQTMAASRFVRNFADQVSAVVRRPPEWHTLYKRMEENLPIACDVLTGRHTCFHTHVALLCEVYCGRWWWRNIVKENDVDQSAERVSSAPFYAASDSLVFFAMCTRAAVLVDV